MLTVPRLVVPCRDEAADNEIPCPSLSPSSNSFLTIPSPTERAPSIGSSTTLGQYDDILKPDPGTESDFQVEESPFAYSPGQLNKLLNPKSLPALVALGGLPGLAKGLRTDIIAGLRADEARLDGNITFKEAVDDRSKNSSFSEGVPQLNHIQTDTRSTNTGSSASFADRKRVFKKNEIPAKKAVSLWRLIWMAYNDKILILLTVAAVISLVLGLYETFGVVHTPDEPKSVDWVEGVAICVAIIIVVLVGSLNDWQKEKAFVRLNAKKDDREVKVTRSGKAFMINIHDILVGDVLNLEPGDLIPVDGIFISGHNVKCDESSATGESDQVKKTGGEQALKIFEGGHKKTKEMDPFIISGSKVLEGVGTYLVTSVGVNSSFGKIMMSMRTDPETTPLQVKLNGLASAIAKLGSAAAGLLFFVLFFRFCAQLPSDQMSPAAKASSFMNILIVAITVIVVAVPEGLPLAVTLALAFATTRLLKENNLVRILKSCEVMGNATTVCSDKTGTLTTNKMSVVAGTFAGEQRFEMDDLMVFTHKLSKCAKEHLVKSIAINSTAFETQEKTEFSFIGSKTEVALLQFARQHLAMDSLSEERANTEMVQFFPFDSTKKCMGAVIKKSSGGFRFFVKGASEILLNVCTSISDLETGDMTKMEPKAREGLEFTIKAYAKRSLRTIALVHRDFDSWPPAGTETSSDLSSGTFDLLLQDVAFDGVFGIMDPLRPGVREAVTKCQLAGVKIRMVTGDNVNTARAIATECGILQGKDEIVLEGPVFRNLSDEDLSNILPRLTVLARSSPTDKQTLVKKLKALGETVAVTGDGTNDGPALKAADVGFSMGIAGTEVAKEASSIVLMDDNFSSIVKALMWGRAVNDAVSKFLQFQITVNITAVLLTFISAVTNSSNSSVLTAVQLLWVNLIMDTFAALALATDPPTEEILNRKPASKKAPLITTNMWKMITGQAIFQLTVTFILYFGGSRILGYGNDSTKQLELDTMVFNTFVWMQIFNELNNRRLDNKFNVFAGIHRNYIFIAINAIMVGAQIAIVFVGGKAFSITSIDGTQWAICILLAAGSLPVGVLIRLLPDEVFAKIAKVVGGPIAMTYQALARVCGRIIKKVSSRGKGKKESKDANSEDTIEIQATVPDIVIQGDVEHGLRPVAI